MAKKIVTGVIAAVLLITIAVFAAEKVKEKVLAEKPKCSGQPAPAACESGSKAEGMGQHERLLDQLAEAYQANDREKMGEIIGKMQERREKMREFVKLNRWHKWAHRRMMKQMGSGWGQGQQMAGPGCNRGWAMGGPGGNQGCPMAGARCGKFQAMAGCCKVKGQMGGMGNCGPKAGGFGQMPCRQPGMDMNNCMPRQDGLGQMHGWGRGFKGDYSPGQGADNMGQQWNMHRRERANVPPAEWGW